MVEGASVRKLDGVVLLGTSLGVALGAALDSTLSTELDLALGTSLGDELRVVEGDVLGPAHRLALYWHPCLDFHLANHRKIHWGQQWVLNAVWNWAPLLVQDLAMHLES